MEIVKIDLTSSPPALVLDFASHEKLYTLYGVCLVLASLSLHQQELIQGKEPWRLHM